jgi:hypothetical protein
MSCLGRSGVSQGWCIVQASFNLNDLVVQYSTFEVFQDTRLRGFSFTVVERDEERDDGRTDWLTSRSFCFRHYTCVRSNR